MEITEILSIVNFSLFNNYYHVTFVIVLFVYFLNIDNLSKHAILILNSEPDKNTGRILERNGQIQKVYLKLFGNT